MLSWKTINKRVDVVDLLKRLEIEITERGDDFVVALCPNKLHDDQTPSWKMADGGEKNGLHYCFPCGFGGDAVKLIQYVKDFSINEALDFAKASCGRTSNFSIGDADGDMFGGEQSEIIEPKGLRKIRTDSNCGIYLKERSFGKQEIKRFGLLDWKWQRRVWIPITKNGKLLSWIARSYTGQKPKVMTPTDDRNHSWAMFGFDLLDFTEKEISLSEGWASAIRVYQAGFVNSIATCGSNLTEEQIFDLLSFEKIVVWQEGDLAGRIFSKKARQWFAGKQIEIVELPEKTDPENFTTNQLKKLYLNRRKKNG